MKRYKKKRQYRLKKHDYSQNGYYFITFCTKNREHYFGDVVCGSMNFSQMGVIADTFWQKISDHFSFVILDEYVIMPNHIHGIIRINRPIVDAVGRRISTFGHVISGSISTIIGSYKSTVSKIINNEISKNGFAWRPRFYDRIIYDDWTLQKVRQYIIDNPSKWESDRNNI